MQKILKIFIVFTILTTGFFNLKAENNHPNPDSAQVDIKTSIKEDIKHHLLDAYDFHLFTDKTTGKHYGFPLLVILWDNGLKMFSSSKLHHGETVAEIDGNYYKLYHNHIYKTNAQGEIIYNENGKITNAKPLDFSITKNVFSALLISILIFGCLQVWQNHTEMVNYLKVLVVLPNL